MKKQHLFWLFGCHWKLEFYWFLIHRGIEREIAAHMVDIHTQDEYLMEYLMHVPIWEWKEYTTSDNYKKYVQL